LEGRIDYSSHAFETGTTVSNNSILVWIHKRVVSQSSGIDH
jgi:hypothetical protein